LPRWKSATPTITATYLPPKRKQTAAITDIYLQHREDLA
jgi:hypothetical protein